MLHNFEDIAPLPLRFKLCHLEIQCHFHLWSFVTCPLWKLIISFGPQFSESLVWLCLHHCAGVQWVLSIWKIMFQVWVTPPSCGRQNSKLASITPSAWYTCLYRILLPLSVERTFNLLLPNRIQQRGWNCTPMIIWCYTATLQGFCKSNVDP